MIAAADWFARLEACIQIDLGGRGLATVPGNNLFTACAGDLAAACQRIVEQTSPRVEIVTGFAIPSPDGTTATHETDGPPGAVFLAQTCRSLGIPAWIRSEGTAEVALRAVVPELLVPDGEPTVRVAIERSGPSGNGEHLTMRGRAISRWLDPRLTDLFRGASIATIGIGDGGNEIGMGRIDAGIIAANIPDGARVRCPLATDHLIVAGVSNWGAYALAAGLWFLAGRADSERPELKICPDAERIMLRSLCRAGPLVDGVVNEIQPTVDGLSWDDYVAPILALQRLLDELTQ